jgi:hypothetical protein
MIGNRWFKVRIDQLQAPRPDCILLVDDLSNAVASQRR